MNFPVDAQLPRRMAAWLTAAGCNAIHTLDLPDANGTTDEQINEVADREERVVVTKDSRLRGLSLAPRATAEAASDLDREHQQP